MTKQKSPENQPSPSRRGNRKARVLGAGAAVLSIGAGAVGIGLSQSSSSSRHEASDAPALAVRSSGDIAQNRTLQTTTTEVSTSTTTEVIPSTTTSTPPTTIPSTPTTTESATQQASETLGSVETLFHPSKGDQYTVVVQGIHILRDAPVFNQPTSIEDGAKPILGGLTGNITQAILINGKYLCVYLTNPDISSTGVACLDISDTNTAEFLTLFNNDNPNDDQTPFDVAALTFSKVTADEVNGTPSSYDPDNPLARTIAGILGQVPIGGFNDFSNTDEIPTG